MHYVYYNSFYPESNLKNRFYVGLATIWHGEQEIDQKKMAARTVTDENGNPVITEDGQLKTEQVEITVKVKVPEIRFFEDNKNYQQVVHSVRGGKSKFSAFDLYGDYLIMKQSSDSNIEMAGQCGYDKSYSFRDIGNRFRNQGNSPCTACPSITKKTNITDSYNYSLGSQSRSCYNCAQRYSSRKSGGIQQLLYDEYCEDYTPPKPKPKPKPKPPTPPPVVEKPKKDDVVTNTTVKEEEKKPEPKQPIVESKPVDPMIFIIIGGVLGALVIVCITIGICIKFQKPLDKGNKTQRSPITKSKSSSPGQDKHAISTQEDTGRVPIKLDESAAKV